MKKLLIGVFVTLFSQAALSLESFMGKVTLVESTYMPKTIKFRMDVGNTTCPAGSWLSWNKVDIENNKAVYSTLLTALAGDKNIKFHINDGDTSCLGRYIHLLKD